MKRSRALLVGLACIGPLLTHAGWIDRSGKPVPDAPDRQSSGDFGAQLLLTDSADAFRKIWNSTTGTPKLKTVATVKVNAPISGMLVFSGCQAGRTVTLHAPFTLIK